MKVISTFLISLLFVGCTTLGTPMGKQDILINLLENKKEKMIFLVGEKYTYIFSKEDDLRLTRYADSYDTMKQVIVLMQEAKTFRFLKRPNISIKKMYMLNGEVTYNISKLTFRIEFTPTIKQIEYLNNIRYNFRQKNSDRFSLHIDKKYYASSTIEYAKTRCFLGNCIDSYEEYILDFSSRYIHPYALETTKKLKNIKSKLIKPIKSHLFVSSSKEHTQAELEQNKKKLRNRQRKVHSKSILMRSVETGVFVTGVVGIAAIILPLAIVASPISLISKGRKK